MLCASHCNFFEYPQSITGSFIFSLFNFQGPTHFLESFLSVLTEPLSTVRELLYHTYFCLSTLFSNFLKALLCALKLFCCFCAFLKRLCYYITPFYKLQPLFSIFFNFFEFFWIFLNFLKKSLIHWLFRHNFFKKAFIAYKYALLFVFYTLDAKDLLFILL